MSLNKPTSLKLQLGQDLRKVPVLPSTIKDLRQTVSGLFGSADFHYRYLDEEKDLVTITTDLELQLAYQTAVGPSLRVVLTPLGGNLTDPVDMTSMSSLSSNGAYPSLPTAPQAPTDYMQVEEPTKSSSLPEETKASEPEPIHENPTCCQQGESTGFQDEPKCPIQCFFGKLKKKWCKGWKGKKRCGRDGFMQNLVRQEVCAAMGIPAPVLHYHVKCDGCGQTPLVGARFKCTVCSNFDFCEVCEAQVEHPHPFLKLNDSSATAPQVTCTVGPVDSKLIKQACKNFEKVVTGKKPKMDFLRHGSYGENEEVREGAFITKEWVVKNSGTEPWPEGTTVRMTKGNVPSEAAKVDTLFPGEEGTVRVFITVPMEEGVCKGVFRLFTPAGRKFGEKLQVSLKVTQSQAFQEQLNTLLNMGFEDVQRIQSLLEECKGDLNAVVAKLL